MEDAFLQSLHKQPSCQSQYLLIALPSWLITSKIDSDSDSDSMSSNQSEEIIVPANLNDSIFKLIDFSSDPFSKLLGSIYKLAVKLATPSETPLTWSDFDKKLSVLDKEIRKTAFKRVYLRKGQREQKRFFQKISLTHLKFQKK